MLCEEEQVAQLIASAEQSREQHAAVLLAHLRGHARKRHMIMQLCLSRRRVAADPEWHEANSTIGWVHKHALELPDRTEVNVRPPQRAELCRAGGTCAALRRARSAGVSSLASWLRVARCWSAAACRWP